MWGYDKFATSLHEERTRSLMGLSNLLQGVSDKTDMVTI